MDVLGNGLEIAEYHEDALTVREAELSMLRRLRASEESILIAQNNLANIYRELGHLEQALSLHREVYARSELGSPGANKFLGALNLAGSLTSTRRFEEAKSLLRKVLPEALRLYGPDHDTTLVFRRALVRNVGADPESSLAELRQAEADLSDVRRRTRRIFGTSHPESASCEVLMGQLKATIAARARKLQHNSGDA